VRVEWTPFMRDLQRRQAAGREYIAALPPAERGAAERRLYALGLWLAEEIVDYRMQIGTDLWMAAPPDQKRQAAVRLWARQVAAKPGTPFPALPADATREAIFDRIWTTLWRRSRRYAERLAAADADIAAEREREMERRFRACFGGDRAYRDALAHEKHGAKQAHFRQQSLAAVAS